MNPGRVTEPSEIKKLKGTLVKSRVPENELSFKNMSHIPEPPNTFDEASTQLWLGCCMSLQGVGLLFAQDLPILEQYVYSIFMVRLSRGELMKGTPVMTSTNKGGFEYQTLNKWIKINLDYSVLANRLGGEFGFSPSSRTKISTGKPSETDPLDDFQ